MNNKEMRQNVMKGMKSVRALSASMGDVNIRETEDRYEVTVEWPGELFSDADLAKTAADNDQDLALGFQVVGKTIMEDRVEYRKEKTKWGVGDRVKATSMIKKEEVTIEGIVTKMNEGGLTGGRVYIKLDNGKQVWRRASNISRIGS